MNKVYDSSLERVLKMEFIAPNWDEGGQRVRVLSTSEVNTLVYAAGTLLSFDGVKLLCSVDENYSFFVCPTPPLSLF